MVSIKNINPKVSIIIPVYNGEDFLRNAIDSALKQTYNNIEVIVINDGSNDNGKTEKIAKVYGDKIKYYDKNNGGVSSALNYGIKKMTGDYFSWLSHDDEYYPDKIEKQVELLKYTDDAKMVALCGTDFIDINSNKLEKNWIMPKQGVYSSSEALEKMMFRSFSGIALLIPKEIIVECGLFDEKLRYTQDADMWRKIFLSGYQLIVDNTILARSRIHGAQQTNLHRERFARENEKTAPIFCERLCNNQYYSVAQKLWYLLLKNNLKVAANSVENILKEKRVLNLKIKIVGMFYRQYGKIRPRIRKIYYRVKFGIDSKGETN